MEDRMSAAGEQNTVVELRSVDKTYSVAASGELRQALKGVNFTIKDVPGRGQCKVLLGPSGCGKSTILRLIAGLITPSTGEVLVDGKPVVGPGSDRGMVFQSYSSFPWLTVLDNVRFGLDLRGTPRAEGDAMALDLIKRVGLDGTQKLYPGNLSGGMRQRVAIARTMACRPRIILMDEPFGALDPKTRRDMQDLVASLWFDGDLNPTFIFVTHDIQEAIFLGDSVVVMKSHPGEIVAEIETPPPTAATREAIERGQLGELEHQIVQLIYGADDGKNVIHAGHVLVNGQ
jgi:NitT/TauT family transport system ATP-binding protein